MKSIFRVNRSVHVDLSIIRFNEHRLLDYQVYKFTFRSLNFQRWILEATKSLIDLRELRISGDTSLTLLNSCRYIFDASGFTDSRCLLLPLQFRMPNSTFQRLQVPIESHHRAIPRQYHRPRNRRLAWIGRRSAEPMETRGRDHISVYPRDFVRRPANYSDDEAGRALQLA